MTILSGSSTSKFGLLRFALISPKPLDFIIVVNDRYIIELCVCMRFHSSLVFFETIFSIRSLIRHFFFCKIRQCEDKSFYLETATENDL